MESGVWCNAGMKASPRFREATAYIKLRHQPAQIKYPLLSLHIAANPQAYDAAPLNVRDDVRTVQLPFHLHKPNLKRSVQLQ